jgi:hypothetical protein
MTVAGAAAYTGLPARRIYELVAKARETPNGEHSIPFVPIEARIYFRESSLDAWIDELEVAAQARQPGAGNA